MTDLAVLIADDATFTAPVTRVSGKICTTFSCLLSLEVVEPRGDDVKAGSSGGANGSVLKSVAETNDSGMKAASANSAFG